MYQKKKIVLYGIGNCKLRTMASKFLSDNYEIIGVSDAFYSHDHIENRRFIPPKSFLKRAATI